jgi:hypothetical protein
MQVLIVPSHRRAQAMAVDEAQRLRARVRVGCWASPMPVCASFVRDHHDGYDESG